MKIRRAEKKDTDAVLDLLGQVLEIHASIRPDLFISGTTKYTREELADIFQDDSRPVYVAEGADGQVTGYAFCVLEPPADTPNMVPHKAVYIDDICVDQKARGQHVGEALFDYVRQEAAKKGYYELELNVWEGNNNAAAFYRKMGMKPKKTCMELVLDEKKNAESPEVNPHSS